MNKHLFSKLYPFDVLLNGENKLYSVFPWPDVIMLEQLLESFPENGLAVEIGSWTGMSTCLIGSHVKGRKGKLYAIDSFVGQPNIEYTKDKNYVKEILNNNIERFGLKDTAVILEGNSDEFVDTFDDESIDFMFIDGDHRYSQISKDIRNWLPKIKTDGILSGHDFNSTAYEEEHIESDCVNKVHHGVSKAVMELSEYHKVKAFHKDGNQVSSIWFINKGCLVDSLSPQNSGNPEKVGRDNGQRTREEEARVFESVGSPEFAR